jgi:carboxyl-terminal processing protease
MMTAEQKLEIVQKVRSLIAEKHVNPFDLNYDYARWQQAMDAKASDFCSGSDEEFERGLTNVLAELGTSHIALIRGQNPGVPSTFAVNAGTMAVKSPLGPRWMFRDVVEDGPAHRAGIAAGDILLAVDGEPLEPPQPALFRLGKQNVITLGGYDGRKERQVTIDLPAPKTKDRPPLLEPKAVGFRYLGDGVGYLRTSYFPGAVGYGFIKSLEAALQALQQAGSRKFVLDLRGNPGGGLGSLRLMSLLGPASTPIGYSLTRRAIRRGLKKENLPRIDRIPKGKLEQIGMLIRFKLLNRDRSLTLVTENLVGGALTGSTVLLVNDQTKSAAEMVVAFCKEHRLTPIVGQKTPGEVLGAVNFKLLNGYRLRMPIATWQTWAGEAIEGRGISPDIAVDLSPEQLVSGEDTQLTRAIAVARSI